MCQEQLRCARKKTDVQNSDTKSVTLKQAIACLSNYLPSNTVAFIESQATMSQQSKMRYRWNPEDKMIVSDLFKYKVYCNSASNGEVVHEIKNIPCFEAIQYTKH